MEKKEIERIKRLYYNKCNFNIAKRIGRSKATVKRYTDAFDAGFETPLDYDNVRAVEAGYKSHTHRYAASRFLKKNEITEQEEFERNMERRGLIRNSREHLVESIVPDLDLKMDRDKALEILATRHYNASGITYGRKNPSGAKEARIIRGIYYEGMNLFDLGRELDISKTRVGQIRGRGLRHLYRIMTGKRFR